MGDMERRLERLEVLAGDGVDETAAERAERLRMIKEGAESANNRALRDGRIPPFVIAGDGYVSCVVTTGGPSSPPTKLRRRNGICGSWRRATGTLFTTRRRRRSTRMRATSRYRGTS